MKCFIILFSYSLKSYYADSKPFEHITLCCYFSLPCVLFFLFFFLEFNPIDVCTFLDCSLERGGMCCATNVSHLLLRVRKPHVKD